MKVWIGKIVFFFLSKSDFLALKQTGVKFSSSIVKWRIKKNQTYFMPYEHILFSKHLIEIFFIKQTEPGQNFILQLCEKPKTIGIGMTVRAFAHHVKCHREGWGTSIKRACLFSYLFSLMYFSIYPLEGILVYKGDYIEMRRDMKMRQI